MVIHPQAPILTQPGAVLAAVKDAKRRAKGAVAKRPSLTAPARAALCVVRPGRRNGPFQPNKETTLKWVALAARARKGHACHPFQTARRQICIPRSTRARQRIVIIADEYLRAHMDRPIYTNELCGTLAVSTTALADSFRATFGVTPHRFLKLRRMSMVRAGLQSYEGPTPLIKSVALAHGFWHLGQFSHDYRETFGEMPSETLARARG